MFFAVQANVYLLFFGSPVNQAEGKTAEALMDYSSCLYFYNDKVTIQANMVNTLLENEGPTSLEKEVAN